MTEIARACYLEDLIMGKKDSADRDQISQYIEMAQNLNAEEIVAFLNNHMKMRMFVVGKTVTAADICLFALAGPFFSKMDDREK
jgi:glutathione S-transferase